MAGNNNLAVRILINAVDNASRVFGTIQTKWAALATALGTAIGAKGLSDAVQKAADFEAALDLIQSKTGANTEEMGQFEAAAVKAGSETAFTATEAANALAILGAAGLSASDSIATLPSVLNLATVEGIGLEQAAGLVTDSVTVMGLSFQESARATDVMVKAANLSSVSAVQMGESLKYAGAVAANAGLSIEQTAAVLDVLASNGLRGEQAGTQLRNILGQLGNPASKAREELAALGITTGDLSAVVDGLAAAGPAATSAIVAFGVESGPALQALMKGGSAAIADYTAQLQGAQGAASEAAGVMGSNLTGAFNGLSSAWDTLSIALTQPLLEPITKAVTELTDKLRAAASDGSLKTFSDALVNGFNEAVTAVKTFISEFNLSELPTRLAAFVDEAKGLLGNLTDSVIVATNTFKTVWNGVYQAVALVGSGLATVFSGILSGVATVASGLESIGLVADGTADSLRLKAEAISASAEAMKAESVRAYEEMRASGMRVVDAMGRIVERTAEVAPAAVRAFATATESAEQLAAPISEAEQELRRLVAAEEDQARKAAEVRAAEESKQAALQATLDELARLRAEYERLMAIGDTQAAAGLLTQIQSIEERLRGAGDEADGMAAEVVEAFKTLGVTSQAELDQLAENAKVAFETIKSSGTAAPADITAAFTAYAERAIAANGGVADSAIKAQAAQLGLTLSVSESGDVAIENNAAVARSYDDVGAKIREQYELQQRLQEQSASSYANLVDLVGGLSTGATEASTALKQYEDGLEIVTAAEQAMRDAYEASDSAAFQSAKSAKEAAEQQIYLAERTQSAGNAAVGMLKMLNAEIDSVRQYSEEAADALDTIFFETLDTWQSKISEVNELNAADFINTDSIDQARAQVAELEAAAEEAALAANRLITSFDRSFVNMGPFYDGLGAIEQFKSELLESQAAALRTEIAIEEMGEALDGINDSYNQGELSLAQYIAKLEQLRHEYSDLADEDLADVEDALADAKAEQEDLVETAVDGLQSWREKLLGIYDQEVAIQQLNWQQDRLETEIALAEARRNGNAEEIAALEQQLSLIDEYYQYQVELAALQEAQNAIDEAEDAADEAERLASLSEEERAYEATLEALKKQLAAAIKAGDEALKQSIIDQIAAEKRRHETVMANLEDETAAKTTTVDTGVSSGATSGSATQTTTTQTTETTRVVETTSASKTIKLVFDGATFWSDESNLDALLEALERVGLRSI